MPSLTDLSKAVTLDLARRKRRGRVFSILCLVALLTSLLVLALLLVQIAIQASPWLDFTFLTNYPSRFPERAGIKSAIAGSFWMMVLTALITVPVGLGAAVYLEEYLPRGQAKRLIQLNIANLAGVPSVIYGILGLALFVRFAGLGRSLLAGALTLSLLILPVVIVSSQEALRSIPKGIRDSAYALGATRWQVVSGHLLPIAAPGALTGIILALSRAIGETAPLIMIGALTFIAFLPSTMLDPFTVLPIQIFNWTARPQEEFHGLAAGGIVVLLAALFLMNLIAILLRNYYDKTRPR